MLSCTPEGRNWKYNSLNINTRYSRLGDSMESLGRDFCVSGGGMRAWLHGGSVMAFRVKNYEILGVFI